MAVVAAAPLADTRSNHQLVDLQRQHQCPNLWSRSEQGFGGWQTRSMFSRYNVMNTERVRAAMEKGGQYVADRIRNAGKV